MRSPVPQQTSSAESPGPSRGPVGGAFAPAVVEAGAHQRVEQVVARRDPVEHAVDLLRELGGVPGGLGRPGHGSQASRARRGSQPAR